MEHGCWWESIQSLMQGLSLRWRRQNDQIHAMFIWDVSVLPFHIELENIVLDELHLLLWIGDVLVRNLILFIDSRDHRSKAHRGVVTSHIKELEAAIWSCGVSFQVQQKREANGKPTHALMSGQLWHGSINCSFWIGSLRRCQHYCYLSYVKLLLNSGR